MSVCQWCLSPEVRWQLTAFSKRLPFENKAQLFAQVGSGGWVHRWLLGDLTMIPVTDVDPDELRGVRWVWVRHVCPQYQKARELATATARRFDDYERIMQRELDEIRRRRERVTLPK